MRKIIMTLIWVMATHAWSQATPPVKANWKMLSDVLFTEKYVESENASFLFPEFGSSVKRLEGQEIIITGYMFPLDVKKNFYVLSANAFANCFFCGRAGPESIIQLKLKKGHRKYVMDEKVTIKGVLKLNDNDVNYCNYILEEAVETYF